MLKRPALALCAWHATRGNFPLIALAVFHSMIAARAAVEIQKEAYHGWNEALIISNGKVEAVVVPAIGRIMQFRFAGQNEGPFGKTALSKVRIRSRIPQNGSISAVTKPGLLLKAIGQK